MKTKSYHISVGPSKAEIFSAIRCYPKKAVDFELAFGQTYDCNFLGERTDLAYLADVLNIYIYEIRALLVPLDHNEIVDNKSKIAMIKDWWIIRGFVEIKEKFQIVSIVYNTKDRTGTLYWPMKEG